MTPHLRRQSALAILIFTAVWAVFMLVSLRTGLLNCFYFDTTFAHVQGIDFFPVERGWRNLLDGRSMFDTFHSTYGPRATWLVYHPGIVLVLGPVLMAFQPWTAYAVWSVLAMLMLVAAAWVIARRGTDPLRRAVVGLVVVGGFPTFILLYSGNVQAVIVLAVALIFAAVDSMRTVGRTRRNEAMLLAGLLLSLFSKPIVLPMLLLLLLLPETRRSALRALAMYLGFSLLVIVIPAINPAATDWSRRWLLLTHLDVVRSTMNVYTNGMVVTRDMQDNGVHWLGMLGFTDYRLLHVDVYSLPALLDGLFRTSTPNSLYRVPLLLCVEVSLLVALIRDRADRFEAALLTLMATSLILFLSYGLVWEYHYTGVFPIVGLLLVRGRFDRFEKAVAAIGAILWLPGLFVFFRHADLTLLSYQTILRLDRVLPVVVLFALLLYRAGAIALGSRAGLRLFRVAGHPPK